MFPLLLILGIGFVLYEATKKSSSTPALPPASDATSPLPPVSLPFITNDQAAAILTALPDAIRSPLAALLLDPAANPTQLLFVAAELLKEGFVDAAALTQMRAQQQGAGPTASATVPDPRTLPVGPAVVDAPADAELAVVVAPSPAAKVLGTLQPNEQVTVVDPGRNGFAQIAAVLEETGVVASGFAWSGYLRSLTQAPSPTSPSPSPSPSSPFAPPGSTSVGLTAMFVVAPHGLQVRPDPSTNQPALGTIPFGHQIQVVELLSSGWARIQSFSSEHQGFVCNTCPEAPGGPWLSTTAPPTNSAAVLTNLGPAAQGTPAQAPSDALAAIASQLGLHV